MNKISVYTILYYDLQLYEDIIKYNIYNNIRKNGQNHEIYNLNSKKNLKC